MKQTLRLRLAPPARLDTSTKDTALTPGRYPALALVDITRWPGRVRRSPGVSRAAEVAGSASTIVSAGVFVRRDCRKVLVDQSAGGTVRAHVGHGYGSTINPPCVGPIALGIDPPDDMNGRPGDGSSLPQQAGDSLLRDGDGNALAVSSNTCTNYPDGLVDAPCDEGRLGEVHMFDCPQKCPKSRTMIARMRDIYCKDGLEVHFPCGSPECVELAQAEWDLFCIGGEAVTG